MTVRDILDKATNNSNGTIRVYTLQPYEIWEALQDKKQLYVSSEKIPDLDTFRIAYDWMSNQMSKRIAPCKSYPWWAWVHPEPKLSTKKGKRYSVRIELDIPIRDVLQLSAGAWDMVLNNGYVGITEAENEQWDAELAQNNIDDTILPLPEPYQSRLIRSWDNIFNLDQLEAGGSWSVDWIQAVFEELRLDQVARVMPINRRIPTPTRRIE